MKKFTLLFCFLIYAVGFISAQNERYVDEIFDDVTVMENQVFGVNATVFAVSVFGEAIPQSLVSDVYMPTGDTETARPLVLIFHTGNFLDPANNGGCGGTIKDADVVDLATRLAKMGYVAAACDYRLGWNPIAPDQFTRVFTIINAAYRGVQDSRVAVKYFRNDAENGSNQYGVDPSKIAMWGYGTGAYVTYGSATLNDISDTYIPEFLVSIDPFVPMIIEPINGDLNADNVGIAGMYPPFPDGDTLCYPNLPGIDASFNLAVQMGGALGDTSWITPGDVPMISYHVPTDPFAPCTEAVLTVPGVNLPVVEVNGACLSIPTAVAEGVNDIFALKDYIDPITAIANERSGGTEGLFLFPSSDPAESAPWNYASSSNPYNIPVDPMCDTDGATAEIVMDTVMQYFIPRACITLDLGCDLSDYTNTTEITADQVGLRAMPNPAQDHLQINAEKSIQHIFIYDMTGKVVRIYDNIHQNSYDLFQSQIGSGLFVAQVYFAEGVVAQKIIFN